MDDDARVRAGDCRERAVVTRATVGPIYGGAVASPGSVQVVVVGVDGSAASATALRWACAVVDPAGTVLAVHSGDSNDSDEAGVPADSAESWVARAGIADDRVVPTSTTAPPAAGLLDVARQHDADLVVIGAHEQRHRMWHRLGAIAHALLSSTDRPVAVVGADWDRREASSTVVAGVGDGPATRAALRWSAAFAAANDTPLELIRALPNRPVFHEDGLLDVIAFYVAPDLRRTWAVDDLERIADEIQRSTDAELSITWSARPGAPGPTLVEAGSDAALLVVGLHERPRATNDDVPAWLRRALLHAPCPVVIVPPASDA
jgi:nucleotide-binding universal stress UspA family protein